MEVFELAGSQSSCEFKNTIAMSCHAQKVAFHSAAPHPPALTSSASPLPRCSQSLGDGVLIHLGLGTWSLIRSIFFFMPKHSYISLHCKRKLIWPTLWAAQVYWYKQIFRGRFDDMTTFGAKFNTVTGSILGPMTSPVTGFFFGGGRVSQGFSV